MPDLWIDVDAALTEVPVNIIPLIDDTDFKTRETGVAYNAAGMDLVWNFTTTAGATTQTAVTPTTAGDYDWAHQGDGMYTIEVPASGGASINNDTEGFGWFTGLVTGVLPWRGPIIGFRAAALNNALIDGGDILDVNTTQIEGSDATDQINAACDASLVTYGLDHLVAGAVVGADVVDDSIIAQLVSSAATADWDTFVNTTEALQAIRDRGDAAWTTGAGTGLSPLATGTAQAGAAGTITLAAGASATDNLYKGERILITGNTGVGQARIITAYDGTPKVATIDPNWTTTPDNTSAYEIQAADADIGAVGADNTIATNLVAQYDGSTGLTGETFPATQAQLGAIALTGAAVNTAAESYLLTTGTQSSGTVSDTTALDGTNHEHTDTAGAMDLYYQFDIGGDGVPTSVTVSGYLNGPNDDLEVYAYNWGGTSWDQIGELNGKALATNEVNNYTLFTSHVGTGANLGKVRIRFTDGAFTLTSATLAVDQIYTSYAIVTRSVGYADGAIWVDTNASNTNTESFVDGTADNPVSTWAAALTLSGNLNINRFHIKNGTTVTLSANSDAYTLLGDNWNLALGSQSIVEISVHGAHITGIGTAASGQIHLQNCHIGAATLPPAILHTCGIGEDSGQFTAGSAGEYVVEDCYSMVPGQVSPVLVFSGLGSATGINNRGWKGSSDYTLDSDCTLSHEVLAGGGQTITTGGADVELRGICRSVTAVLSAAETFQFVGVTGPIALSGTTTASVNLYGVSASLADTTSAATVTDRTVSQANINTEVDTALSDIALDHLMAAAVTGPDVVDDSVIAQLASKSGTADWDSFDNTTDSQEAIADSVSSSALTVADIADGVWDETINSHTTPGSTGATLNDVPDNVWDEVMETGAPSIAQTARQWMRLMAAALFGETAGVGDWSAKSIDGNKTRISATLTATGQRSDVDTLDGS